MATAPIKLPYKKLSANEWLQVTHLAEEGMSVAQIAKNFGVHSSVIYRGLKKRGVKIGAAVKDAEKAAQMEARDALKAKIKETKDKDYRYTQALQELMMKTVVEGAKLGSLNQILDSVKSIKIAIDGVRAGTGNKWKILGLDREDQHIDKVLPELPIREMTDREVEQIRRRQEEQDEFDNIDIEDMDNDEEDVDDEELAEIIDDIIEDNKKVDF